MPSDTPRLPKGPKPHKFVLRDEDANSMTDEVKRCKECDKLQTNPIHSAGASPADNPPGDPDTGE